MPGMEYSDSIKIEPAMVIRRVVGRCCTMGTKALRNTWENMTRVLDKPLARASLM